MFQFHHMLSPLYTLLRSTCFFTSAKRLPPPRHDPLKSVMKWKSLVLERTLSERLLPSFLVASCAEHVRLYPYGVHSCKTLSVIICTSADYIIIDGFRTKALVPPHAATTATSSVLRRCNFPNELSPLPNQFSVHKPLQPNLFSDRRFLSLYFSNSIKNSITSFHFLYSLAHSNISRFFLSQLHLDCAALEISIEE